MEHLRPETLARLVGEATSPEEASHLAACRECADELDAFREQTSALGDLSDLRPPRGAWETLEARLASEGLVRKKSRMEAIGTTPGWMRIAAAAVIFVGGAGVGAAFPGAPLALVPGSRGVEGRSPFTLASDASTAEEAAEAVQIAERQFMDALVRYRQLADAENGAASLGDPEARVAALEYLVAATQAAMRQAPADPFLNGLLASAMAERQAARQDAVRRASRGEDWY